MLKICVVIVITDMEDQNNHGIVSMINCMPMDCVKIVILIDIIRYIFRI